MKEKAVLEGVLDGLTQLAGSGAPAPLAAAAPAPATAQAAAVHQACAAEQGSSRASGSKCQPVAPLVEQEPKKPCLDNQACGGCSDSSGEQIVCDWCQGTWHLDCLQPPLTAVPEGMWLCPGCAADTSKQLLQECLRLEGRWVRARFGRSRWLWGCVEYTSHGELAVRYEDGSLLSPYSVQQLLGQEAVPGHSKLTLLGQGQDAPELVVVRFMQHGWLEA